MLSTSCKTIFSRRGLTVQLSINGYRNASIKSPGRLLTFLVYQGVSIRKGHLKEEAFFSFILFLPGNMYKKSVMMVADGVKPRATTKRVWFTIHISKCLDI